MFQILFYRKENIIFVGFFSKGNALLKPVNCKLPSSAKLQLQLQLCWLAELALISVNSAPPPPPGKVYLVAVAKLNNHSGVQEVTLA